MKSQLKFFSYLPAILGITLFLRPADNSQKILLWIPKLFGAALSPVFMITGILGAFLGFLRRDRKLTLASMLGFGLSTRYMLDLPNTDQQFGSAFGSENLGENKKVNFPSRQVSQSITNVDFQRNVVCGQTANSGAPLLADLWQPGGDMPHSGLGIVYAHGSGWRVGDKDMLTRHFFQRLVRQGHVVLDIAYTLWPHCELPTMVAEFNQAILWLKENSANLNINPQRIIAMGGSAGGHLALLAAYAPNQPEFKPFPDSGDTSVRGVVAYYPPADLLEINSQANEASKRKPNLVDRLAQGMMQRIFIVHSDPDGSSGQSDQVVNNMFTEMLGGTPQEIPEVYKLLSPIEYVGAHCPPTLLLQGQDDVFNLAPGVYRLHQELHATGATSILVDYPHTEHGFDLVLPHISPVAKSATREVELFLSYME